MPSFGNTSKTRLETCHPKIQELFSRVVKEYDCSVLEGARSKERQQMLFDTGKSKTLNSKHIPKSDGYSYAVDVVPYPIAWGANEQKALMDAFDSRDSKKIRALLLEYRIVFARFYHFAGYVKGVANEMGIKITWGGDWNSNNTFSDQSFHDLPHFQLDT